MPDCSGMRNVRLAVFLVAVAGLPSSNMIAQQPVAQESRQEDCQAANTVPIKDIRLRAGDV